jgi:hypothetical protein
VTSPARVNASRLNGRKGRGPKTAAGKMTASRNALRHGLSATTHGKLIPKADIAVLAMGLCGNANDPALFRQAEIIAENVLILRAIAQQQVLVIERLHDPSARPFSQPDKTHLLRRACLRKQKEARKAIIVLRDALLAKHAAELPLSSPDDYATEIDELFPADLEELLQKREERGISVERMCIERREPPLSFDEGSVIEAAAKDLCRLERYERRAASRMQRAILAFIGLQVETSIKAVDHP